MTPLVSIIIPTFDRPRYLQEAIESGLAQTYSNIEVLIFDNGTLDETLAVAGDAARRDPRVRFQRNERNLGMSANFNALARAARGEFLVAIGDDDRLLPEFVSRLVGVMRPELGVAFSNHYLINAEGTRLEPESREYTRHYGRDTIPAGVLGKCERGGLAPIDPDVGFTFAHRRSPATWLSGRLEYARRRIFHPSRAPRQRASYLCRNI